MISANVPMDGNADQAFARTSSVFQIAMLIQLLDSIMMNAIVLLTQNVALNNALITAANQIVQFYSLMEFILMDANALI